MWTFCSGLLVQGRIRRQQGGVADVVCPNTSCGREMRIVRHRQWQDIHYWKCDNCKGRVFDSLETCKSITDRLRGLSNPHGASPEDLRDKESLFS
jgi:hypothetical protein